MRRRLSDAAKRLFDLVGAVVAAVLLSPILLTVGAALLATQGRPIFFRQQRPGLHGRPFTIVKFRTMRAARRGEVWYASDEQRVTKIGHFLRSTSLDELPELWNVIRGEMSLVGPRPLLMEYMDRYTPQEGRRHEVRPGITGWAAVNGRHASRFESRLELDVWYVDHRSLALDLRILATTVRQVLSRTDVSGTQDFEEIDFPERFLSGLAEGDAAARPVAGTRPGADPPDAESTR
jgi:sugar transferase EpsL